MSIQGQIALKLCSEDDSNVLIGILGVQDKMTVWAATHRDFLWDVFGGQVLRTTLLPRLLAGESVVATLTIEEDGQ